MEKTASTTEVVIGSLMDVRSVLNLDVIDFKKPNLSDWWLAGCSHCLAQAWKTLNQRLSQIVSGSKISKGSKFLDFTFFQSDPISNQLR